MRPALLLSLLALGAVLAACPFDEFTINHEHWVCAFDSDCGPDQVCRSSGSSNAGYCVMQGDGGSEPSQDASAPASSDAEAGQDAH
jgi:hypothetical protein